MNHLFYVQSHITFLVARATIELLDIKKGKIVFLVARNYRNKLLEEYPKTDLSDIHYALEGKGVLDFRLIHPYVKRIDYIIKGITSDTDFTLYLPQVRHKAMQIIATHERCKILNIIEEGTAAYSSNYMHCKDKSNFHSLLRYFFNRVINIGKGRFYSTKPFEVDFFIKSTTPVFIALSKEAFNGINYPKKVVVVQKPKNFTYCLNNKTALVLDGLVEQGVLEFKVLLKGIEKTVMIEHLKEVYLKYHPAQTTENIKKIKTLLKKLKVRYCVIPQDISFEQIALSSSELRVIGFNSSLLFYSKLFNPDCYVKSYGSLFFEDRKFRRYRAENDFDLTKMLNQI